MSYSDTRKLCKKYGVTLDKNMENDFLAKELSTQHDNAHKIDLGHESVIVIIASYTKKGKFHTY